MNTPESDLARRFRRAAFVLSTPDARTLPADSGAEVAFAGRSNAGKSSAINAICEQGGLARTSKTPGRTQQLVVFDLGDGQRLVDLPGYGYARVPLAVKQQWHALIDRYVRERASLRGIVVVSDVRHALTDFDRQMLHYCQHRGLRCLLLLSKADKLNRGPALAVRRQVLAQIADLGVPTTAVVFSARSRDGVDAARVALSALLDQ
ncbi:MAG: YihA family ribosome biogenesis GTP-binding protein [Xanthomonadales bacterium]|nr:putative GTP-binding protein EngB [Xanthomonadales bacterium]MCC6592160.1 YihA family ribosome biogenesis GTP-binding protein [Xanthomonadales bacterium]MCE7931926.1 YihA family ribosome biogenesis GTP-binding protein [Xanthomonadales bacterium PRO6]